MHNTIFEGVVLSRHGSRVMAAVSVELQFIDGTQIATGISR